MRGKVLGGEFGYVAFPLFNKDAGLKIIPFVQKSKKNVFATAQI
jgi:hypothetical protein